jgi:hypothetical protein
LVHTGGRLFIWTEEGREKEKRKERRRKGKKKEGESSNAALQLGVVSSVQ